MLLGPPCLSIRLDTSGNVEAVVDAPRIFQAKRRVEAAASGSRLAFDWNYRRLALKCPAGRASRGRAIFTVRVRPKKSRLSNCSQALFAPASSAMVTKANPRD